LILRYHQQITWNFNNTYMAISKLKVAATVGASPWAGESTSAQEEPQINNDSLAPTLLQET
jgi:hypothetical protein